ncbi:TauD/TfdA dioxygenase family protein [Aspergillus melleus]|uniref:TauD/TfdA dioxygenase family protein n=1 Tax=Aspergillus melleus TaxID=138277 RepID=UPI001E8E1429|nr:uncharacterized protein LDX57_001162 [Aspergillus melleus]KAH8423403.1 hypothetical protein LDX57_001162 [Aspergillus melleus]
MAHLQTRRHISPDSGFPVTLHPKFNAKIKDHVPPDPIREPFTPPKDRASFADKEKKALFSVAKRVDLTESIGTVLENVQLSQLSGQQLDELALLVNERGVVFFRDQDLTTEKQVELFEHYDDTILDLWGVGPNRPPIDTHHPAVRTHPVTGLKALNVNPGFVTGFAELKKLESDKLLDFLSYHIHAADDHYVRWKWAVGSVAMWDNRVIPGTYKGARRGIRTTVFGEKPYLNPTSESRLERQSREESETQKEHEKDNEDIGMGQKLRLERT